MGRRKLISQHHKARSVVRKFLSGIATMKVLTIIIIFLTSLRLTAQDSIVGRYRTYFGDRLQINADLTFKYNWNFDLSSSWTKGTWTLNRDTVLLHMVPTYDTIRITNGGQEIYDSLILSADELPELVIPANGVRVEFPPDKIPNDALPDKFVGDILSGYQQNGQDYPKKLVFKKGRLYTINNGRLVSKKIKGFWTKKKWPPWYFKSDQ